MRSLFSVLIPSESGERVSFIVALELSMIFIQQAVDSYIVPAGQDRNFPFIRTVIIGPIYTDIFTSGPPQKGLNHNVF